jgi:uncharacterized protein YqeY
MTFQLQSQSANVPPDYKKLLDEAVQRVRTEIESGFVLIQDQSENPMLAVLRRIEAEVQDVETRAHQMHANADEIKAAVGKLRKQRDEAIKARNQVLAYLRAQKKR